MKFSIKDVDGTNKLSGVLGKTSKYFKSHKKFAVITVVWVLAVAYGVYSFTQKEDSSAQTAIAEATATRGSIEVTVTGTGTIIALANDDIGKGVTGTVEKIYVKNGDKVKKGQLLMEVSNNSLEVELENARLELENAAINLDDASSELSYDTITSPISGRIVSLETKTADEVSKNEILATIQDDSQLVFNMPINSATAQKVSLNQKVEVFLPDKGDTLEGRVISKNSQAVSGYNGENRIYVKVAVPATGNLAPGVKAFGSLTIDGKKVDALSVSDLEWIGETEIKATLAGKVDGLFIQEGQTVKKGQKLFTLSSDDAQTKQKTQLVAYKKAQLNVTDLEKQINDLTVLAPIDGYITGIEAKEGDEIENGTAKSSQSQGSSGSTTSTTTGYLGKVINTNQMEVSFPVDEVDIAKVKLGQVATITVDALPDQEFKGKVTEIAEEGVVTNNVSSFDVTILIDNTEKLLKSGMTANVTIVVASKENVVLIPVEALQERGQRKFILTPGSEEGADAQSSRQQGEGKPDLDQPGSRQSGSGQGQGMKPVTVGLINESYAEIIEGLQEGEKILLPGLQAAQNRQNGMFPGMGGGVRTGGSGASINRSGGNSGRSAGSGGMR